MKLINGIGGAFIFSSNARALAEWYTEHFGFAFEGGEQFGAYYQAFFTLDPEQPERKLDFTFSIFKANEDFSRPAPSEEPGSMYGDQPFMLNLRTDDLNGLLARLESKGVAIISRMDEAYGLFAWVRDIDGNRIELYQPVDLPSGM